ncbi:hypothetical protein IKW73_00370 [Candidatus Saccharibacteria bacterium]|nr:hypothetical protein [Candidatus Saccharibacteria bacterium]
MATNKVLMYQMYPMCWGSLKNMEAHLRKVKELGCTHVWLSPFFVSPGFDHGYDVSDYCDVDEKYGSLRDFDSFVKKAHSFKLKVVLDLVMNHTSTFHSWLNDYPDFYIWADEPNAWTNWFDGQSAWTKHAGKDKYFCHMFSAEQADLNWFPDGEHINEQLVSAFQSVVSFWEERGVDGFRLDAIQAINKDFEKEELSLGDMLIGDKACKVINAVFPDKDAQFILAECLDVSPRGDAVRYYLENSNISCCNNILLKDSISDGLISFMEKAYEYCQIPGFMLELESHDSPRFTSRSHLDGKGVFQFMFTTPTNFICLYNGQELGLKNPTKEELPDAKLLHLDVQSKMRYDAGEPMSAIRPLSRANARVKYPTKEWTRQAALPNSALLWCKYYTKEWKNRKK